MKITLPSLGSYDLDPTTNPPIFELFKLIMDPEQKEGLSGKISTLELTSEELSGPYDVKDLYNCKRTFTALQVAAGTLSVEAVSALLENGANPKILAQGYRQKWSPLHAALYALNDKPFRDSDESFRKTLEIIDLLRENKADMATIGIGSSGYEWSPFGTAEYVGLPNEKIVELIKHGISPNVLKDGRMGSDGKQEWINNALLKPIAQEILDKNSTEGLYLHPDAMAIVNIYIIELSSSTKTYTSINEPAIAAAVVESTEEDSSESSHEENSVASAPVNPVNDNTTPHETQTTGDTTTDPSSLGHYCSIL